MRATLLKAYRPGHRRARSQRGLGTARGLLRLRGAVLASVVLALPACAGSTPTSDLPDKARPDAEERPPGLAPAPPWSIAEALRGAAVAQLDNGLSLRVLERPAVPLVELHLVLAGGSSSDGDRPGVAALTLSALELMAELATGRELTARVEAFGGRLQLQTTRDASVIALTLPSSALEEGLGVLATLTAAPAWSPAAFEAARARELGRLQLLQRSPVWLAEQALYAELFRTAPRRHPYAHADTLPSELQRLTLEDSKSWHERTFAPGNATLLVVGDTSREQLLPLAQRALGAWQKRELLPTVFFAPPAPTRPKTLLVHLAGATRSELRIAALGPERSHGDWPAFAAAQQLLGGGDAGRLRRELTRRGELAVELSVALVPVAHGATPLVISASTSTERTGLTLAALLDSLAALSTREPARRELLAAQQQLTASVPLGLATSAEAAESLTQTSLWRLQDEALDGLRRRLGKLTASELQACARRYLRAPPVVIVVGDAPRLLAPLSHFGQVHVLDPERDFQTERVVSQDPTAPLEGPGTVPSPAAGGPSPR